MLHVVCGGIEYLWHVGENFKGIEGKVSDINKGSNMTDYLEVQADGDELQFILDHFKNLPHVLTLSNKWYGDDARFIVGNIHSVTLASKARFVEDHIV